MVGWQREDKRASAKLRREPRAPSAAGPSLHSTTYPPCLQFSQLLTSLTLHFTLQYSRLQFLFTFVHIHASALNLRARSLGQGTGQNYGFMARGSSRSTFFGFGSRHLVLLVLIDDNPLRVEPLRALKRVIVLLLFSTVSLVGEVLKLLNEDSKSSCSDNREPRAFTIMRAKNLFFLNFHSSKTARSSAGTSCTLSTMPASGSAAHHTVMTSPMHDRVCDDLFRPLSPHSTNFAHLVMSCSWMLVRNGGHDSKGPRTSPPHRT